MFEVVSPPRWVVATGLALGTYKEKLPEAVSGQEPLENDRGGKWQHSQLLSSAIGCLGHLLTSERTFPK